MIEQKIQELIEALNSNTAALLSKPVTQTELPLKTETLKKQEPAKTAAPTQEAPTIAEWREIAQKLLDAKQRVKIDEINQKFGLKRITEAHGTDKASAVFEQLKSAADAIAAA